MPPIERHVLANVAKIEAGDNAQLKQVLKEAESRGLSTVKTWEVYVEMCDTLRIADKLPGSVGTRYKKKYAEEAAERAERIGRTTLYINEETANVLVELIPEFVVRQIDGTQEYEVKITNKPKARTMVRAAVEASKRDIVKPVPQAARERMVLNRFLMRI